MNYIELNKFSKLHDGKNIIFCKTDYIMKEFENINRIHNDVILITANSDYAITDDIIRLAPTNIKKWFAQNALSNSDILTPLPLGLENKVPSLRDGHGIGYLDRVTEKEKLLMRFKDETPNKFIYSNFNIHTNISQRIHYKNISMECDHIDWEENNLTLENYFDKLLTYKMILCPIGNGVDTHRLWETLYSDRIPITVKIGNYKIYDLYEKYPIIILNDISELKNKTLIDKKYDEIKRKVFDKQMLTYEFWETEILKLI